jgi:uncharacterized peroxidase-related enzyme
LGLPTNTAHIEIKNIRKSKMRLQIIEPDETVGTTKDIFKKLVMVPNVLCLMANSEPVFENYTHFHYTQPSYKLAKKYRKMVSLAVSQFNDCLYCVALHTSTAIESGILSQEECLDARRMKSTVSKTNTILKFTKDVLENRGKVNDSSIKDIKRHGFTDQEIIEILSVISFITLANFTANVGKPELDFIEPPRID